MHAGPGITLENLKQNYFIPQGRKTVAQIIKQGCFKCKRYNAQRYEEILPPPLPENRVTQGRAFRFCGLDYFGPIITTEGKVWGMIITCHQTRAVHLELVSTCAVDEFILALERFVGRRGYPTEIISDNAKQFVSANKILQKTATEWQSF